MKTRLALSLCTAIGLFAGCDGNHSLGSDEALVRSYCCYDSVLGAKVQDCPASSTADNVGCTCDPSFCGKGAECRIDSECPQLRAPCQVCADGSEACPSVKCIERMCVAEFPSCPKKECEKDEQCPVPQTFACEQCADGSCAEYHGVCKAGQCAVEKKECPPVECKQPGPCPTIACFAACPYGSRPDANGCETCDCLAQDEKPSYPPGLCVPPNDSCVVCSDGSKRCAEAKCDNGQCKVSYPVCPPAPGCTKDEDCPTLDIACKQCLDGTTACPTSWCENPAVCPSAGCGGGTCHATTPQCREPKFCGGIASFPCPDGYTCVDDPRDDCSPDMGGADCGGICVVKSSPSTGSK
jgi:hypothetical protein